MDLFALVKQSATIFPKLEKISFPAGIVAATSKLQTAAVFVTTGTVSFGLLSHSQNSFMNYFSMFNAHKAEIYLFNLNIYEESH